MFLINLIIVFVYIMLAVLSRKHFSKYKKIQKKNFAYCVFLGMGETLWKLLGKGVSHKDISKNLRKCQVVSSDSLEELSREYVVKQISLILAIFLVFNIISGVCCLRSEMVTEERVNVVVRDDYGGDEEEYKIKLEKDGETYEYLLGVAPLEYSVDEIYQKVEAVYQWLESAILGDNVDLQHVSSDLVLPDSDEEGLFDITWDSDNPMLITSEGEIVKANVKDKDVVIFSAEITYLDYTFEKEIPVTIEMKSEELMLEEIKNLLAGLEREKRDSKELLLPSNIQGVNVSIDRQNDSYDVKVMLSGIVLCVCILFVGRERLREAGKKRDAMLIAAYPAFVNKMYLLLWTGMTIKHALMHYVSKTSSKDILSKEIEYTLNQISSGVNEVVAYEELGQRLMIPEYSRFMNQIAHNLKRGNYDLFDCMEKEVDTVLANRKEHAKKIGEEASTKMLLPMILLMVITMVIVIVPALYSF